MDKIDIRSMTKPEIEQAICKLGIKKFRAAQIYSWLCKGVCSFEDMTDLSNADKSLLNEHFYIASAEIEKRLISKIDGTVKYLFRLIDGQFVESVLMEYHHGYTICVSSQVGCRMGCSFCASTIGGLTRNLTAGEILAQITSAQIDRNIRISNIVMMGMGEPLDNYDNVIRFLELVNDGLGIGMRHISLSTCGRVDGIYKLLERNEQLTLSVSLHAPNDDIRSRIMPINNKWSVDELLDACRDYINKTHRRVSFEYAMIKGVNDTDECADELSGKLRGMLCHVNLIPANEVRENDYQKSERSRVFAFQKRLIKNGINATVRRTLGSDISASCGQLRQQKGKL